MIIALLLLIGQTQLLYTIVILKPNQIRSLKISELISERNHYQNTLPLGSHFAFPNENYLFGSSLIYSNHWEITNKSNALIGQRTCYQHGDLFGPQMIHLRA